ncbi:MAG: L-glutamate gamma-semialdehyde dehydrogenase [Chitinophagales bacterium]|nr:L-glutamate gamma-semialdehyde dehydrogenase [Chitinophagales bacterium]
MSKGRFTLPEIQNEPVLSYAPKSAERRALDETLKSLKNKEVDIPMFIGGKEITTSKKISIHPPHETSHVLGHYHKGDASHVEQAIDAALKAKEEWEKFSWEDRAAIFLKAADLLAGPYRYKMNAATMLGQSKNVYQSEIDAVCELIDFLRFNVKYMLEIYEDQPNSMPGIWNNMEYRPLEGFILAVTPFNFTSIGANLAAAPALMGNTIVWKPSNTQIYSAWVIMELFREAGLPDGVINIVYTDGPVTGDVCFNHKDFAGIHFTGSTATFQFMWKTIGNNIANYRSYPRIVGETGGKDFVIAHPTSDAKQVATALSRGAFEYQGQKCSAASRAYIPENLWDDVKKYLVADLKDFNMGTVEKHSNFINAVIDERSFDSISSYIENAKKDGQTIIAGGNFDKSEGYFIEPTVIQADKPDYTTMCEEIFGPVLTIYVYKQDEFDKILDIADRTSPYALTGAIFSKDRAAIAKASWKLRNAAGNFYINDKPTGAVVDQQPFGGARASGTNDKAGSKWNLIRWVSPRSIKENFVTPSDYRYPFLG